MVVGSFLGNIHTAYAACTFSEAPAATAVQSTTQKLHHQPAFHASIPTHPAGNAPDTAGTSRPTTNHFRHAATHISPTTHPAGTPTHIVTPWIPSLRHHIDANPQKLGKRLWSEAVNSCGGSGYRHCTKKRQGVAAPRALGLARATSPEAW